MRMREVEHVLLIFPACLDQADGKPLSKLMVNADMLGAFLRALGVAKTRDEVESMLHDAILVANSSSTKTGESSSEHNQVPRPPGAQSQLAELRPEKIWRFKGPI